MKTLCGGLAGRTRENDVDGRQRRKRVDGAGDWALVVPHRTGAAIVLG